MSDNIPLPGIIVRWLALMLSLAATLVLVSRWTAQIDASLQMVNYRLLRAEAGQDRIDQMLNKAEGMQRLLDDRMVRFDAIERDSAQRKKTLTDMHTSIDSFAYRVHEF